MIKVAIVGFGFMGRTHYGIWKRLRGVKVAAICDANLAQLKNRVAGNHAESSDRSTDFTGIAVYDDFGKMLAAGGFDTVDVTLPTFLHPAMAEAALAKGLNVICEKPMAVDAKACDRMLAAAARSRGRLMVAQCVRFAPETDWVRAAIGDGRFGKVTTAFFTRTTMTPGWTADGVRNWFLDESKSGGVALDLHIHDTDLVHYLFGVPESVSSRGHRRPDGALDEICTAYAYPDKVVTAEGNWGAAPSFVFESGYRIVFEDGTVVVSDTRRKLPLLVYPAGKGRKPFAPKLPKGTEYEFEIRRFAAYLAGRVESLPIDPKSARNSVAIVDAERRSAAAGGRAVRPRVK